MTNSNVLLLSYDGNEYLEHDEEAKFKIIVNTWNDKVESYPHNNEVVVYAETQRLGEVMWIQSKVLRDLKINYNHVCVYCHDVKLKVSDVNKLFEIGITKGYDSYSPAMTSKNYSHKQFIKNGEEDVPTNWVENMASFFSKRFYDKLIPYLDLFYEDLNLVSGWGLDTPLAEKIIRDNEYKCMIINSIVMEHTKVVTSGSKEWRNGLSSDEVYHFITEYLKLNEPKSKLDYMRELVKGEPPTYVIKS